MFLKVVLIPSETECSSEGRGPSLDNVFSSPRTLVVHARQHSLLDTPGAISALQG